jgi:hypothetical protein
MKYLYLIFFITLFWSCKMPLDCEFSSVKITKSVMLPEFEVIEVNPGIELFIEDSDQNTLKITADRDVIENITYEIKDGTLILTNPTECLIQNRNAEVKIVLEVNDIRKIIGNTDLKVRSVNTWHFNQLELYSENFSEGTNNITDYEVTLNCQQLTIVANGNSDIKVSGQCQNMFVGFYGGNPRLEANQLDADVISVFHRSNADMWLKPLQKITGDLYGYGDIYLYHRPPVINITIHDTGHIYFVN